MGFKRFLAWLVEKLVELHLGVAALLAVKFFMPVTRDAYASFDAFTQGVRETSAAAWDDASFVAGNFLGDSTGNYALHLYLAAAYVLGFYFYLSSLYLFLSLLAVGLSRRHYLISALLAYLLAFTLFCVRSVRVYDDENLIAGAALLAAGAVIVVISASLGQALGGSRNPLVPSVGGRVRLDFSH